MPDLQLGPERRPRDSLAAKIIFFVFLSTFVTALVVSWISIQSTYAFLRSHLDASYPALLQRSEAELATWLGGAETALAALATAPGLRAALAGPAAESGDAALAEALAAAGPDVVGLVLVDAAGAVRARAAHATPQDAPDDAAKAGSEPESGAGLVATAPIRGAAGEPIGTLVGSLSPEALARQLEARDGALVHIVDASGIVRAAAAGTSAFASFPPELIERAPPARVVEFTGAGGVRALGAHTPLGSSGRLRLVVAQPLQTAFAPVFAVVTRIFVIDLAIVLLFSFLAYEITTAIVRPLEALSEGARRISQGELSVEIDETRSHDEIGLLTRTFNDMARRLRRNRAEIDEQHRRLQEQNEQLQRANEVLEQLSITDGLTKLHNHRYFQDTLTREIKRVSRTAEPLSILLVDIDDFKALNDRLGHAEGDALLARIARILNESVRESDVLARYGGEEFVVLATGTDLDGAVYLAEKVRTAVAESVFASPSADEPVRVTVSVGVAQYAGDRRAFFDAADRALYRAKGNGKNCVVAAEPADFAPA